MTRFRAALICGLCLAIGGEALLTLLLALREGRIRLHWYTSSWIALPPPDKRLLLFPEVCASVPSEKFPRSPQASATTPEAGQRAHLTLLIPREEVSTCR
jgi:hypothetical protein